MHTEGHDAGRDTADSSTPGDQFNPDNPGYETTDVNTSGIAVFLAGLFGTVIVFFFFCYGMGKVINNLFEKQDGNANKWTLAAGGPGVGRGKSLASNPEIEQQQLQQIVSTFPTPRPGTDDDQQQTADLHAREDLLLDHTTKIDGQAGAIRIPIDRAMELIAQRGLPVTAAAASNANPLAYAATPALRQPLTTGFARTGFELTTIEARKQKINFNKAEGAAEPAPAPIQ
jgi:hypothetical protein